MIQDSGRAGNDSRSEWLWRVCLQEEQESAKWTNVIESLHVSLGMFSRGSTSQSLKDLNTSTLCCCPPMSQYNSVFVREWRGRRPTVSSRCPRETRLLPVMSHIWFFDTWNCFIGMQEENEDYGRKVPFLLCRLPLLDLCLSWIWAGRHLFVCLFHHHIPGKTGHLKFYKHFFVFFFSWCGTRMYHENVHHGVIE